MPVEVLAEGSCQEIKRYYRHDNIITNLQQKLLLHAHISIGEVCLKSGSTLLPAFQVHSLHCFALADKISSHILNSKHFAETMRDITLLEDEVLVNFNHSSPMYS